MSLCALSSVELMIDRLSLALQAEGKTTRTALSLGFSATAIPEIFSRKLVKHYKEKINYYTA